MSTRLVQSLLAATVSLSALALPACQTFEGPPIVTILGLESGILPDRKAPIVLTFSKPYDPKTLKVKIARFETDDEGNLFDEDTSEETKLTLFYTHDTDGSDNMGVGVHADDHLSFTITPSATLPVGAALVVLVEP